LADAAAAAALPEHFQGNSLALLQAVYRDTKLDLRVRVDAASKALPYEVPKPEFATPAGDVVPLHERLRAYARARLIQASEGKVVDTGQSQKERVGLPPVHRHRQDLDENGPAFRSKTPDDAEGINAKQAPPRAPDWRYADDAVSRSLHAKRLRRPARGSCRGTFMDASSSITGSARPARSAGPAVSSVAGLAYCRSMIFFRKPAPFGIVLQQNSTAPTPGRHRSTPCAPIGLEKNSSFPRQSPSNISSEH
jgi:hypothetical protein